MIREAMAELLRELIGDITEAGFVWINKFVVKPTTLENLGYVEQAASWVIGIVLSLHLVLLLAALLKNLMQEMEGTANKSPFSIVIKSVKGIAMGFAAPWLLISVLLQANNFLVLQIVGMGLNTKSLEKSIVIPEQAGTTLLIVLVVLSGLFLVLGIQYIIRLGELCGLFLFAPVAALTIITDDTDLWSVWWRESLAVVFQQTYQVLMLWIAFNSMAGGKTINDYILSIGLMIVTLKGHSFLRKFLYSSGSGRSVVGAAGGAGKMAMYRFAMKKAGGK